MLSAGGALLIGTGAAMSYLKAQQPEQQMSDLTLANIEAMAVGDTDFGLPIQARLHLWNAHRAVLWLSVNIVLPSPMQDLVRTFRVFGQMVAATFGKFNILVGQ